MSKTASLLAVALAALCFCSPAHALSNRAWVSGHGADTAGCGAPTAPCRTFQYVVSNIIAPSGEIDVLDPAGYGAVTIPFALSIVNDGVGTAGVQAASGNAITINAGASDKITLRGLNVDGLGTGSNGIVFNSGGGLSVVDCVFRHFAGSITTGNGILIQPSSGSVNFLISNVIASDNAFVGVYFLPPSGAPSANGVITRVTAVNDEFGVVLNTVSATGGSVGAVVSDTIASNNAAGGIFVGNGGGGALTASIDGAIANGNPNYGILAQHSPTVLLGRSVFTSNSQGVVNQTSPNGFYSYGDNRINGNATDILGAFATGAGFTLR
jgi:hypothetical protein